MLTIYMSYDKFFRSCVNLTALVKCLLYAHLRISMLPSCLALYYSLL